MLVLVSKIKKRKIEEILKKAYPNGLEEDYFAVLIFGLLEKKKEFEEIVKSSQHFEWDRIIGAVQYFKQKEYLKIINAED